MALFEARQGVKSLSTNIVASCMMGVGREVRDSAGPEGYNAYLRGHFHFEPGRLAS